MTVGELISKLSILDENQKVVFAHHGEVDSYQFDYVDDCCFMMGEHDIIHDEPYPGEENVSDRVAVIYLEERP